MLQLFGQHDLEGGIPGEAKGPNPGSTFECTANFANLVIESYFPEKFYRHIPSMLSSNALVTRNLTGSEWVNDERGVEAVKAEATGLRANDTWDDASWLDEDLTSPASLLNCGHMWTPVRHELGIDPRHAQGLTPVTKAMQRETTEILAVLMQDQGLSAAWGRTTGRDATVAVVIWLVLAMSRILQTVLLDGRNYASIISLVCFVASSAVLTSAGFLQMLTWRGLALKIQSFIQPFLNEEAATVALAGRFPIADGLVSVRRAEATAAAQNTKTVELFGLHQFIECLLLMAFEVIGVRGTSTQAQQPTITKAVWLLLYLRWQYELKLKQANEKKEQESAWAEKLGVAPDTVLDVLDERSCHYKDPLHQLFEELPELFKDVPFPKQVMEAGGAERPQVSGPCQGCGRTRRRGWGTLVCPECSDNGDVLEAFWQKAQVEDPCGKRMNLIQMLPQVFKAPGGRIQAEGEVLT
eukprot:s2178_g1.t3